MSTRNVIDDLDLLAGDDDVALATLVAATGSTSERRCSWAKVDDSSEA
jgi:hypothetical protein